MINPLRWKISCAIFIGLLIYSNILVAQCNGFIELCSKSYNEVAYLTSHNAYSNFEDGFFLPNQNLSIPNQLELGVRALMLDIYEQEGELLLYHSVSQLGSSYLVDILQQIKFFMINHPNEIITLILEDYSSANSLDIAIENVGLSSFLYSDLDNTSYWPTLQEMIDLDQRLILFTDNNEINAPETHYYIWDFAVESNFENISMNDFSCEFNRGEEQNDLFIFNHFLSNYQLYLTNPELYLDEIQQINDPIYLSQRLSECILETEKFPNFIVVDFVDFGQPNQAVDELNQVSSTYIKESKSIVQVFPNPSEGIFFIKNDLASSATYLEIYNIIGVNVTTKTKINRINSNITIDFRNLNNGTYFLRVDDYRYTIVKK